MLGSTPINAPNDPVCVPAPADTVQSLKWAPTQQNFLCAAGWDGKASVWEISPSGQSIPKAQVSVSEPVLSASWKSDISGIFLGSCDNQVRLWTLGTSQMTQVGQHGAPVREVLWCDQLGMVISGSWDSSVAFWDGRQPRATAQIPAGGRVFGMTLAYPLLAAILSDRKYAVWNLERVRSGQTAPEIVADPAMRYQIRSISASVDAKSLALGHIEGRCSVKRVLFEPNLKLEHDFMFKCHRDSLTHSVNAMCFNAFHGITFATGGSDASVNFWDKNAKQKVKSFTNLGGPVTAMDFKADGTLFAYATGYDWHKGVEGIGSAQPKIAFREALEDAKPKPTVSSAYRPYGRY